MLSPVSCQCNLTYQRLIWDPIKILCCKYYYPCIIENDVLVKFQNACFKDEEAPEFLHNYSVNIENDVLVTLSYLHRPNQS